MNENRSSLSTLLSPLASLTFTVVLLALAMVLIFAGTTVQTDMGIWDVQHKFFHSWFCIIDWRLFFPLWDWGSKNMPGKMPFPGGYTLITLLLVNLLAAHTLRFKMSWKRSGIFFIHAGIILLLVGEVITAQTAVESQMPIDNGSSSNWSQDIRDIELAITDRSAADHDTEVVIPRSHLRMGEAIENPAIPFTVKIERFYINSDIAGPMQTDIQADKLATTGVGSSLRVIPLAPSNGTESRVDEPSAFVTLMRNGQALGTYLVSTMQLNPQFPQIDQPQVIDVDGKTYWMQLRFKREYKPYTMNLIKFSHDRYTGTDVPRNYSSLVRIVDPKNNTDREVLIWMNHPLRYNGETFYQASFKSGDSGTVLQIVHNPGWLIPYISCSMVALGMLIHFGMHLLTFLSRRLATQPAPLPARISDSPLAPSRDIPSGANGHRGGTAVLERKRTKKQLIKERKQQAQLVVTTKPSRPWLPAAIITGVMAIYLIALLTPAKSPSQYDMDRFARIPVTFEGRTMPLDSLARNSLRIMSGKSQVALDNGNELPAINWLLDVFADPDRAQDYKVFRIDHPDIKSLLGLSDSSKTFSIKEIFPKIDKLQEQYSKAREVKNKDPFQRQIVELAQRVILFNQLASIESLYLSPPLVNAEWRPFGEVMQAVKSKNERDPGAESFMGMIQSRADNSPEQFNALAASYSDLIEQRMPDLSRKLDTEVRFNRADPFIQCMALYVIVFILAAASWIGWHKQLSLAALSVLILALVWHTLALGTRIYLQGRPPVTNLYSSAIFIAWAAVVFCVAMEFIYRNGVPSAAAAALAFPSLLIAHYLAASGDTMQMLQAVLDTNIWLATHVVVVTLGYAATFLAGFLAIGYVLGGVFSSAVDSDARKNFYRMTYGVVCFAMLFSFVGTILGGIWADQSWGRFWGWDPKENGAVLIVLWNAILLHARWGGLVRERGFMLLAVGGNIITAWSWFGTNMLGVGLHSYGFMDSALFWLASWVGLQILIIAIGSLPQHVWRSFKTGAAGSFELA
jgi:ABC-type transport system involved in cytochrome c biogenesis permease subunit